MEAEATQVWAWLGREAAEFGARWIVVMLPLLGFSGWFGWRHREMKRRLAALEARAAQPAITQTFNFHGGVNPDLQIRNAIEARTFRDLKETISDLPQTQLSGGNTYATLPNGTNIVTMADGSVRLALPINLSATFVGGISGSMSARLTKVADGDEG